MRPGARLATFLGGAVAGSALAAIGASTTWYRTIARAHDIPSSIGNIHVRGAVHSYSAGDLGSPIPALALLCLVLAVLAYLVGPRARALLVGLVAAGAASIVALSFFVPAPAAGTGTRQSAPGRVVAPIGAAVALGSAVAALPLASSVRRVSIPESGPSEE